jgi:hypothetical protein
MKHLNWTKLLAFLICLAVGLQGAVGRRKKSTAKSPPPMVRNRQIFGTVSFTYLYSEQIILALKNTVALWKHPHGSNCFTTQHTFFLSHTTFPATASLHSGPLANSQTHL